MFSHEILSVEGRGLNPGRIEKYCLECFVHEIKNILKAMAKGGEASTSYPKEGRSMAQIADFRPTEPGLLPIESQSTVMVFFTAGGSEAMAEGIHRGIAVEMVSQSSQRAVSLLRQFVSRFPSAMTVNKDVRYHVWNLRVHLMAWGQVALCFTAEAQDGSGSETVFRGVEGRSLDHGGPGLLEAVEPTVVSSRCLGARSSAVLLRVGNTGSEEREDQINKGITDLDLGGSVICKGNAGSLTVTGLLQAAVVLSTGGSVNLQGLRYTYEDEVSPMAESLLQVVSFAVGELTDLLLYGLAIIENFIEVRAIAEGSVADCRELKKLPATDLVDGVLAIGGNGFWFADYR
ncbi:hypothetical protein NE237_022945 [Protea cynaroides]|uniref:Uncharacterized protein n=1 Tax=Protea cynaroides TaxID=273540 RepID=A0A9Q0HAJ0_9MAGN|nr:hypothetical protein NE237_022945 [Protea cynaroides]